MRGMALVVSPLSAFEAPRGTYPAYRSVSSSEPESRDIQILLVATVCPGAGGLLQTFLAVRGRPGGSIGTKVASCWFAASVLTPLAPKYGVVEDA